MTNTAPRPLDVDAARVARGRDQSVLFDDPASPWLVRVWVRTEGVPPRRGGRRPDMSTRRYISRIRIDVRPGGAPISALRLARLPTVQMLYVAAAQLAAQAPEAHPNEAWYRMLATPKGPGRREWDPGHWGRVLTVYQWAVDTGRPGGGVRAIADLWGVARNPTAYRWLAQARRRQQQDGVAE